MLSVAHVAKFVLSCTLLGSLSLRAVRGGYQGRPRGVRDAREHMWEGRNAAVSPNSQLHVSVLVKTTAASSCLSVTRRWHDCRPRFGEGKASAKIRRPAKALRQNVEINMTKFHDGESEENGLTH